MDLETTMNEATPEADAVLDESAFFAGFDGEDDAPAPGTEMEDAAPEPPAPPEGGEQEDAPTDDPPTDGPPATEDPPQEDAPADPPPEDKAPEETPPAAPPAELTRYIDAMEGQCRDMYARVRLYEPIDRLAAMQGVTPEEMVTQLAGGFERAMIDGLCNDKGYTEEAAREWLDMKKKASGNEYKPYQPKGVPEKLSFDKAFAELCGMAPEAKGLKELPEGLGAYLEEGNPLPLAWFRHRTAELGKQLAAVKQELAAEKQNAKNRKTAPTPKGGVPAAGQGDPFLDGFNSGHAF